MVPYLELQQVTICDCAKAVCDCMTTLLHCWWLSDRSKICRDCVTFFVEYENYGKSHAPTSAVYGVTVRSHGSMYGAD